jgi:hypothetical protein
MALEIQDEKLLLEKQLHEAAKRIKLLKGTEIKTGGAAEGFIKILEQRTKEMNEKYTPEYINKKLNAYIDNI